jgi:hypothetical protein
MIAFKTFYAMAEEGKGLWHNIHKRRKSGKRMRKPGEKGAPTAQDFKNASEASDFKLTPAREKELEKLAKDLPDNDFKKRYGKDWKSVKIATAMNMLKKKYGFKEGFTHMNVKSKPRPGFKIDGPKGVHKLSPSVKREIDKILKGQEDRKKAYNYYTRMGQLPPKGTLKKVIANEGKGSKPEPFEAGFKRRVVKTTKPEHKEQGYNWRIKGKKKDNLTIKLYKTKPSFDEFVKQMRRVAGHEFG